MRKCCLYIIFPASAPFVWLPRCLFPPDFWKYFLFCLPYSSHFFGCKNILIDSDFLAVSSLLSRSVPSAYVGFPSPAFAFASLSPTTPTVNPLSDFIALFCLFFSYYYFFFFSVNWTKQVTGIGEQGDESGCVKKNPVASQQIFSSLDVKKKKKSVMAAMKELWAIAQSVAHSSGVKLMIILFRHAGKSQCMFLSAW